MRSYNFLQVQDVLDLHDYIITRYGGNTGLRDFNLLDAAIAQSSLIIFGSYLYSDEFQIAATYAFHIIKNHPFVDGNKRTGLLTALLFSKKITFL